MLSFVYTSSGEPIVYDNWEDGEPNNEGDGENCVIINHAELDANEWDDISCTMYNFTYTCQLPSCEGPCQGRV